MYIIFQTIAHIEEGFVVSQGHVMSEAVRAPATIWLELGDIRARVVLKGGVQAYKRGDSFIYE